MNFEHSRGEAPHLILNEVPGHLTRHAIPFAQSLYKAYKEGDVLSQVLLGQDYSVWKHVLSVTQQLEMKVDTKSDVLALNYMTLGSVSCTLHEFGALFLTENKYRLYYVPANVPNYAVFQPGFYCCVHINFHPSHFIPIAKQYPRFHPMLQKAQNKIQHGSAGHEATISKYIVSLLQKITHCDLGIAERTLIIESIIRELLLLYIRAPGPRANIPTVADNQQKLLQEIEHYIETNLDNDLSVQAIARKFNKGRSWLQRLVSRQYGRGLHELVTDKRMEEAARLLLKTKMPVGRIVETVSTNNFSSFCAAFLKRFGMSPLDYRKFGGQKREK